MTEPIDTATAALTPTPSPADGAGVGMVELDRGESLALLASVPVGRVVYTEHALPAVRPVNFVLRGDEILIRLDHVPANGLEGAVVAFEADELDAETRTGWSVVVVGYARITTPAKVPEADPWPRPWAPGAHEHLLSIRAEVVNGRRITRN
jgi:hypothetical protein